MHGHQESTLLGGTVPPKVGWLTASSCNSLKDHIPEKSNTYELSTKISNHKGRQSDHYNHYNRNYQEKHSHYNNGILFALFRRLIPVW